ncbi:MAG: hypothetical protein ACLGG0_14710 [Bacteriovoracia bacterium]
MSTDDKIIQLILGNPQASVLPLVMDAFPLWLKSSCRIYKFGEYELKDVFFIVPAEDLEFDQVVNIQKQVQKRLGSFALIVADDLPKKFRPLLARMNIPYLVKGHTLFAPGLGLKISEFKDIERVQMKDMREEVSPFELKLLAGFLVGVNFLQDWTNVTRVKHELELNFYKPVMSKVADGINGLISNGFIETRGRGPNREFRFHAKQTVWQKLKITTVAKFYKRLIAESGHQDENHILAGETALSFYSTLAPPDIYHIAMTSGGLEKFSFDKKSKKLGTFEQPKFIIDVLKEPPELFCEIKRGNKCLNSIELYFALKNNSDERVQIALEEMLSLHGLEL